MISRLLILCFAGEKVQLNLNLQPHVAASVAEFMMSRLGTEMLTKHYIDFEVASDVARDEIHTNIPAI